MAISMTQNVLNILKVIYPREEVDNLLYRNSPVLKEIKKNRVEGKRANFAAVFGRGGAVGADYNFVKTQAVETARNAEWSIEPGQIFSALTINQKEILSSKSNRGAYMTVLKNRTFAALEAERKTLAKALYGTGFGELGAIGTSGTLTVGSNSLTLTDDVIIGMDVGTVFAIATGAPSGALGSSVNTVTKIDGNTVTFTATVADTYAAADYIVLSGSRDTSGAANLPIGLGAWLPTVANRTGAAWNTYIATPFYGVDRSIFPDRLAGQFVNQASLAGGATKVDTISELFRRCRRNGALVDMIIVNDQDFAAITTELNAKQTLWQSTDKTKGEKQAAAQGFNDISFAFATSWLDKIYDDPYCPKGTFYILEQANLQFWTYSNVDRVVNDGIGGNEPGKVDSMSSEEAPADAGVRINIDDLVTIESGTSTPDGPALVLSFNIYGTFVLANVASSGVGVFS